MGILRSLERAAERGKKVPKPELVPHGSLQKRIVRKKKAKPVLVPLEPCHRINVYTCPEHDVVTVDRHMGTTPMLIKCPECGKPACSRWYRVDQSLTPTYEWRQPEAKELPFMPISLREHVLKGGLVLHKIPEQ